MTEAVRAGQVRQRIHGACPFGSIPFHVVGRSWLAQDRWICESLLGQVGVLDERDVLACEFAENTSEHADAKPEETL
jgi:hypothetical protein